MLFLIFIDIIIIISWWCVVLFFFFLHYDDDDDLGINKYYNIFSPILSYIFLFLLVL